MTSHDERPPQVAFASVGTMVVDEARFHGPAFNRASQMFHEGLLSGLADAGLEADVVLTLEPMPSYPRDRRLFGRGGTFTTGAGWTIRLLPFVNVHPLKWISAGLSVFTAILRWSWRNRHRPRIVHTVNLTMPPGIFIWAAARLTGARTFVSVLDIFRPGALVPDTLYRRLDFAMQRWLLPRFDGLMVVSDAIAQDFVPGRRVVRVEGGLLPGPFAARPAFAPRGDGLFRVVLSGSLEPYNGIDLAIRAAALLPAGYEVVIAGMGTLEAEVRAHAASNPRIRYLGFLGFAEVLQLYWSADLLLNLRLTRDADTRYFFPSKLMELLASGTPVLSTCTGHVEDEYGHVLYLLREETPEALAAAIAGIAGSDESAHRAVGDGAREFMLAHKTWPRQGARLVRYLETEVLGER